MCTCARALGKIECIFLLKNIPRFRRKISAESVFNESALASLFDFMRPWCEVCDQQV